MEIRTFQDLKQALKTEGNISISLTIEEATILADYLKESGMSLDEDLISEYIRLLGTIV